MKKEKMGEDEGETGLMKSSRRERLKKIKEQDAKYGAMYEFKRGKEAFQGQYKNGVG